MPGLQHSSPQSALCELCARTASSHALKKQSPPSPATLHEKGGTGRPRRRCEEVGRARFSCGIDSVTSVRGPCSGAGGSSPASRKIPGQRVSHAWCPPWLSGHCGRHFLLTNPHPVSAHQLSVPRRERVDCLGFQQDLGVRTGFQGDGARDGSVLMEPSKGHEPVLTGAGHIRCG